MSRPLIRPARKAQACANCMSFQPTGTADIYRPVQGIYAAVSQQHRGECRAAAPTRDRKTGTAVWPDVVASDWCRVFERRGAKPTGRPA